MEPGLERWAHGALWAALAGSLALRAARRAPGPGRGLGPPLGRGLVLPLALLAALQSLCRAWLPLPLGLALAAAAAGLLLWRAAPRGLLPVAGRAVLVTGECGDTASTPRRHRLGSAGSGVGCPAGTRTLLSVGSRWGPTTAASASLILFHVQAEPARLYPPREAGSCNRPSSVDH